MTLLALDREYGQPPGTIASMPIGIQEVALADLRAREAIRSKR
jgi:hypothetical protein